MNGVSSEQDKVSAFATNTRRRAMTCFRNCIITSTFGVLFTGFFSTASLQLTL